MQKLNSLNTTSFFMRQHTIETACSDEPMFIDELMLEDNAEIGADMEMQDHSLRKPKFTVLSPEKKGDVLGDCELENEYEANELQIATQATTPADIDSDFASESSDEEHCRFVTRVMRRVPSKIQKVDTSAIEENARKASWMRLKDNFK